MNFLYRTKALYPLAEALSRGVGSSIKSRVDSTGPTGARNSPAHLMKEAEPSVFALSGSGRKTHRFRKKDQAAKEG